MWLQKQITLKPRNRGFHLITREIEAELAEMGSLKVGLLNIFIQHTSASLAINENADPDVRGDFERFFSRLVPEGADYFVHTDEGPDDMPAHLRSSLLDTSLMIPVSNGRLSMGTWQGVYLCEHRDNGGARRLLLTLQGNAA